MRDTLCADEQWRMKPRKFSEQMLTGKILAQMAETSFRHALMTHYDEYEYKAPQVLTA